MRPSGSVATGLPARGRFVPDVGCSTQPDAIGWPSRSPRPGRRVSGRRTTGHPRGHAQRAGRARPVPGHRPADRQRSPGPRRIVLPVAAIKPFALIADALARAGVAVLRYDDRGTAASTGDYGSATIADFTADGAAAVALLRSRPDVDPAGSVSWATARVASRSPRLAARPEDRVRGGLAAPVADRRGRTGRPERGHRPYCRGIGTRRSGGRRVLAARLYAAASRATRPRRGTVIRDYFGGLYDRQTPSGTASTRADAPTLSRARSRSSCRSSTSPGSCRCCGHHAGADWRRVAVAVLGVFGGKDVQVLAALQTPVLRPALEAAGNDSHDRDPARREPPVPVREDGCAR